MSTLPKAFFFLKYRRRLACLALCFLLLAFCLPQSQARWIINARTADPQWIIDGRPEGEGIIRYPVFEFDLWHFDPGIGNFVLCTEIELKCSTNNFAASALHYWADSLQRTSASANTNTFFDTGARFYFAAFGNSTETRTLLYTAGTAHTLTDFIGVAGYVNRVLVVPDVSAFQWLGQDNPNLSWVYRMRAPIDVGITNATGKLVWQPCQPVAWLPAPPEGINVD